MGNSRVRVRGGVAVAVAVELTSAVNCPQATIERKAESGDFRFEKKLLQETANRKC